MKLKVKFTDNDNQWQKTYIVDADHFKAAQEKQKNSGPALKFKTIEGWSVTQFPSLSKMEVTEIKE